MFIAPTVAYDVAMHHLPEKMGATARGVHLLPRDHVAGTHRVLLAFASFPTTLAHADATQCRIGEAAVIVGKFEIGRRLPRTIVRTQTQVFVDAIGVDDLSRIHLPVWIP